MIILKNPPTREVRAGAKSQILSMRLWIVRRGSLWGITPNADFSILDERARDLAKIAAADAAHLAVQLDLFEGNAIGVLLFVAIAMRDVFY